MLPDTTRKDAKAQPIAFDLHGQARKVDLRKMPRDLKIPPADTDVNADYRVSGSVTTGKNPTRDVKGDLKFLPSTVAGAQIAGFALPRPARAPGFEITARAHRMQSHSVAIERSRQRVESGSTDGCATSPRPADRSCSPCARDFSYGSATSETWVPGRQLALSRRGPRAAVSCGFRRERRWKEVVSYEGLRCV